MIDDDAVDTYAQTFAAAHPPPSSASVSTEPGSWWTPERVNQAADYLQQNAKLSPIGAKGLVARWAGVEAKSGPSAVNPTSQAVGIGQWLGTRKAGVPSDFQGQLAHAARELNSTESAAARRLRSAQTPEDAAIGASMYERAEGYDPKTGRDNFVGQTLARLKNIGAYTHKVTPVDNFAETFAQAHPPSDSVDTGDNYEQSFAQDHPPTGPVRESTATLDAQKQAANDPQSTRAGRLFTPGMPLPPIDPNEMDIPIPGNQTLRVDRDAFTKINAATGTTVDDLQKGADYTPFIGGKAVTLPGVGADTPFAVHTTAADGTELNSSGITDSSQIPVQAAMDKLAFPNQPINTTVVPSSKIIADRQAALDTSPGGELEQRLDTFLARPSPDDKAIQPQIIRKSDGAVHNLLGQVSPTVVKVQDAKTGKITLQQKRKFQTSEPTVSDVPEESLPQTALPKSQGTNAVAEVVKASPTATPRQILDQLAPKYDLNVDKILAEHPSVKLDLGSEEPDSQGNVHFTVTAGLIGKLKAWSDTGEEAARKKAEAIAPPTDEALRQKAIEELTNEKRAQGLNRFDRDAPGATPQNLDLTETEIQNRVAEYKAQELSPEAKSRAYDVAQKNSGVLGGSILSGLYGGAGSIIHTAAGVLRPFSAVGIPSGYETLSNIGKEMQSVSGYRNEGKGAIDAGETIGGFLGEAAPSVAEMVVLPGGPVAKFAFLGGAKAAGAGAPLRDVGKGITEGGITGGGFKYAEELKNPLARLGTVFGSSVVANTAVGVPLDQSTRKAILDTTFQFVGDYAPKIIGGAKALAGTYRFWKGGEPVDVELTDKGEVILHSEIDTADSNIKGEIVLDPKNPVYQNQTERRATATVPTTEAEPEAQQYSSVLDGIRQKNLTTKAQIQAEFPQLSREEAADYRRQAWGDDTPVDTPKTEAAPTENVKQEPKVAAKVSETPQAEVPVKTEKPKSVEVTAQTTEPNRTVTTERGTKASIEPKVIDASDIVTSLDKGYPEELQPRDRSRAASKAQISHIANRLDPEQLADSPKASDGRPLVVPMEIDGKQKYVVVSGNGRTEAIRQVYEAGNDPSKAYAEFTQGKGKNGFQRPIYVGELKGVEDLPSFAAEANEPNVARMSATEQAQADSKHLNRELLAEFVPSDDGSIHSAANREFVKSFLDKAVPKMEHGAMVDENGQLSQEGVNRIRNAVFAKAYGEKAVHRLAESTDDNVKRVTNALLKLAPNFVDLKEHVDKGTRHPGLDISADVSAALEKYSVLRNEGTPVQTFVNQGELFGNEMSPLQKRILTVFDTYKYSAKAISDILNNYVELAHGLGDPNQNHLFGESTERNAPTLFREAVQSYEKGRTATPGQSSLFETSQRREVQPETSPASATKDQSRSVERENKTAEHPPGNEKTTPRESAVEPEHPARAESKTESSEANLSGRGGEAERELAYKAAKDLLRRKLGKDPTTFGAGLPHLDTETIKALGTIANYHIENGIAKISELAKQVAEDLGVAIEKIRPHLEEMYPAMAKREHAESKPSKMGQDIKNKAVAEGIAQDWGDTAMYTPKTMGEQAEKANTLISQDSQKAIRIINRQEEPPEGLHPESVYTALRKQAEDTNDVELLKTLSRAKVASESSIYGQKIKMLDMQREQSTVAIMRSLEKGNLTPEQDTRLNRLQETYDKKIDELHRHILNLEEQRPPSHVLNVAARLVQTLNDRADMARERLKQRGTVLTAGLDPSALKDFAEIGASHIAQAGLDFAKWSERMIEEFGDKIKPHLDKIWERSQSIFNRGGETSVSNTLKGYEARLKNQIADMENQIRTGERKAAKTRTPREYDDHIQQLRERRDELQKQVNDIFGKPELTDEQRLSRWMKGAEKRRTALEEKLKAGDFSVTEHRSVPLDEKGRALQAQIKKLNEQMQKMRNITGELSDEQISTLNELVHNVNNSEGTEYGYAANDLDAYVSSIKAQQLADRAWWRRLASTAYRVPMTVLTFGHGGVIPFTHARNSAFLASEMGPFFRAVGRAYAYKPKEGGMLTKAGVPSGDARWALDMAKLRSDPEYDFWAKNGLAIKTSERPVGLGFNRWTNHSFDALKTMRMEVAKKAWNKFDKADQTPELAQRLAKDINHTTGDVNSPPAVSKIAGKAMFAPKLRFAKYASALVDPFTSPRAAKRAAALIGVNLGLLAINDLMNRYLFGVTDEEKQVNWTDIHRADWLRAKVHGMTVPLAPAFEVTKLPLKIGADIVSPSMVSGVPDRSKTIRNEAFGALHPTLHAAYEAGTGEESFYPWKDLPYPGAAELLGAKHTNKNGKETWAEYGAGFAPIPLQPVLKNLSREGIHLNPELAPSIVEAFLSGVAGEHTYEQQPARKSRSRNVPIVPR